MARRSLSDGRLVTDTRGRRLAFPVGRAPGSIRIAPALPPRQGPKQRRAPVLACCRSCRATFVIPRRAVWPHDPWDCHTRRERAWMRERGV